MKQHATFLKYIAISAVVAFLLTLQTAFAQNDPGITSSPVSSAIAGRAYAYSVTVEGTTPITYDLVVKPQGMSINSNGLIGWWPDRNDAGEHPVHLVVTNSVGSDEQQFTVDVMTPPIIDAISDQHANVGEQFSYQVTADARPDPDYDLVEAPAGMSVTLAGLITWTPTADQVGTYQVQVRAQSKAGRETKQFNIEVATSTGTASPGPVKSFRLLSMYPQPATTHITVLIEAPGYEKLSFGLFDLLGRSMHRQQNVVVQGEVMTMELPTSDLAPGVYVLRVEGRSGDLIAPVLLQ